MPQSRREPRRLGAGSWKRLAVLTSIGPASLGLGACGGEETPAPEEYAASTASADATTSTATEVRESEEIATERRAYEAFLGGLTTDQRAVHEQMSPTNMETLSDEEITAVAKIYLDEVSDGSGGIDLVKYSNSLALRLDTMLLGCTEATFAGYGGAINVGIGDTKEIAARYWSAITIGLTGGSGTADWSDLADCIATQAAIDLGADVAPFDAFSYVVPGSVQIEGTSVNFRLTRVNNYDLEGLSDFGLVEALQYQNVHTSSVHFEDPYVDGEGRILIQNAFFY